MTVWWSDDRIDATVSQDYIERELGSKKHVETLHKVLAFGDGLTDDTYLDWILERSPRIFLILNEIGVPERIFHLIDKSFADDDLPISQDTLWELNLFGTKSETLDRKFFREQFNFLVQELEPGGHVDYGTWDVVPVESAIKRPGLPHGQTPDRVAVKSNIYTRKKVPIHGNKAIDEVHFVMHLKALTTLRHSHLVTVWATYSQDDFNYILLTPATETNLKLFLDEPPKAYKLLEKQERRDILLTWTHCLVTALAYLHEKGFTHQALRPSTITIDHTYTVFINDYNALEALDVEELSSPYSNELYDHAAPENWLRKPCLHETAPLKTYLPGGGRTSRRVPKSPPNDPTKTLSLVQTQTTQDSRQASKSYSNSSGSSTHIRPRNALITTFAPVQRANSIAASTTSKRAYASDIFSLTTILLTIFSMILQHSPKSFASQRCRLNRQAGRGNAPPDSSFHKNLNQVNKWIDKLVNEAGEREKKDMKFWGSMVELVQVCRLGIKKEARERMNAQELKEKIGGWVEWGLEKRRKCTCGTAAKGSPNTNDQQGKIVEEPTSKYTIVKPKRPGRPSFEKENLKRNTSDRRSVDLSTEPSVSVDFGSMRPASVSSLKDSTVWGLGDMSQLHAGMMRPASIISDKDSTIWGLTDEPPAPPHFTRIPPPSAEPKSLVPPPLNIRSRSVSKPPPNSPITSHHKSASQRDGTIWGLTAVRSEATQGKRAGLVHTPPSEHTSRPESLTTSRLALASDNPASNTTSYFAAACEDSDECSSDIGSAYTTGEITQAHTVDVRPKLHFHAKQPSSIYIPPSNEASRPDSLSTSILAVASDRPASISSSCIAVGVPGDFDGESSTEDSDDTEREVDTKDWPLPMGVLRVGR
ncbi:hypothetical protein MMC21_003034 [Puttea exsequens]|nr:hypothetical protein [Puttea exsequens]